MDLANLDLDGDSKTSEQEESFELSTTEVVEAPLHTTTEDLHLYYKQGFINRVGLTGVFLLATFSILLLMTTALLIFSYTSAGREFLGTLKIIIF